MVSQTIDNKIVKVKKKRKILVFEKCDHYFIAPKLWAQHQARISTLIITRARGSRCYLKTRKALYIKMAAMSTRSTSPRKHVCQEHNNQDTNVEHLQCSSVCNSG
jgi:type III secretion system FlhB-like substrate exporter